MAATSHASGRIIVRDVIRGARYKFIDLELHSIDINLYNTS
jgi:hypothetical protein